MLLILLIKHEKATLSNKNKSATVRTVQTQSHASSSYSRSTSIIVDQFASRKETNCYTCHKERCLRADHNSSLKTTQGGRLSCQTTDTQRETGDNRTDSLKTHLYTRTDLSSELFYNKRYQSGFDMWYVSWDLPRELVQTRFYTKLSAPGSSFCQRATTPATGPINPVCTATVR